jgi:hypothetical protein
MRVTSRMIKWKDLGLCRLLKGNMSASGETVFRMERVKRFGKISKDMLVSTKVG